MATEWQKITFEQMKGIVEEELADLMNRRKEVLIHQPNITIAICECVRTLIVLEEKIRNEV